MMLAAKSSLRAKTIAGALLGRRRSYHHYDASKVAARVERVLAAKREAGLSYDDLSTVLGVTNTYAAQLLLGQAKLISSETANKLKQALPGISDQDLRAMREEFPMRSFDDEILKEPNVYRTYEAITHYGAAIKSIINEQCGDGIMSAIDFYCDVGVRCITPVTRLALPHGRELILTLRLTLQHRQRQESTEKNASLSPSTENSCRSSNRSRKTTPPTVRDVKGASQSTVPVLSRKKGYCYDIAVEPPSARIISAELSSFSIERGSLLS
jgi:cyanate lyase